MAMTLVEASKLSNDILRNGVVRSVIKDSPILQRLPFIDIVGNGLSYNRLNGAPTAAFFEVGDSWNESTPTFTQAMATLKIMGGDADIDNFLRATRSNQQDLDAAILELKAEALAQLFEDTFVYGSATLDPNSFDGIRNAIAAGQQLHMGAAAVPAALTLTQLRNAIDLVRPGKPDMLLMSRRTRNGLSGFAGASQSPVQYQPDEFGARAMFFDGIPIGVSDYVLSTELIAAGVFGAATGGASTSVFALKFGENAVAGLQNGQILIDDIGALETKDADRFRVKWYCGLAVFHAQAVAVIDGISSAAVAA